MLAETLVVWWFIIAVNGDSERMGPYPTRIHCEYQRDLIATKYGLSSLYVGECYAEHYHIRRPF